MAEVGEKKEKKDDHEGFLERVRKHYALCLEADRENRDRAKEALRFRNLEQWDPQVKNEREADPEGKRPCLVVDKLNQHVQQVVNDERQNRPQIKVRPVDDKGDVEVAKIYDGIIRHIQDASHADIAFDTGFEQAVDGGFGFWRILTEYCDPMSFEQDIRIKRVRNRFAVYLDPERQEPDGSDAKYGFVLYKLSKEKFKSEYGDIANESIEDFTHSGKEFAEWYGEDWVLLAEYYWCEKEKVTIVMLADVEGTVMLKDEYEALKVPEGAQKPPIQAERETQIPKVRWRTITGNRVLKTNEWPSYWIPIVEVVGNELDIEGKVYRSGMLWGAMDAQKVYNYSASSFIENVALAPRAPWVVAAGQAEGYENDYRTANRRNISALFYKPISIDGTVVPPPVRQPPPGVPLGWQAALQNAEHDIQAAMGRYDASLGEESNEKSGKAIIARQRKGDIGSFHFSDNLSRSMRHTGRILVDIIPKYYDTKRVARIIGEDGTPSSVVVDPDLADEHGNKIPYAERPNEKTGTLEKIYNLGVGKYDVTVIVGPSFATKRLEAADFLTNAIQATKDPVTGQVLTYLAIKSNDFAGAEEATAMLKKLLPPNIVEEEGQEQEPVVQTPNGPIPVSQASQAIAQLSQQVQQMGQALEQTDALAEKNKAEELRIRAFEAQTKRLEVQSKDTERQFNATKDYVDRTAADDTALLAPGAEAQPNQGVTQ